MNVIPIFILVLIKARVDTVESGAEIKDKQKFRRNNKHYNRMRADNESRWPAMNAFTTTGTTAPPPLKHIDYFKNLAHFDDADVRGPNWYNDDKTKSAMKSSSDIENEQDETLQTTSEENRKPKNVLSSFSSSKETKEDRRNRQKYRVCHACPEDMMKKFTNLGIKWICAGYQRARRSFKSVCMMRFRNCQDGTMFVKLYDRRCRDDSYHGRHFFYQYPV